jgi:hypothetical protein
MAASGKEGFHFILQDQVLEDTRLPPRGFVPSEETMPVGRIYPKLPPVDPDAGGPAVLAHWDDASYELVLPRAAAGAAVIRARLLYQTTSREYVEFLERENKTDEYGRKMLDIWQRYDRAPPFEMASAMAALEIEASPWGEPTGEPLSEPAPEAGPDPASAGAQSVAGCTCALGARRLPSRVSNANSVGAPESLRWVWLGIGTAFARWRRSGRSTVQSNARGALFRTRRRP